ncbi:hypothetical protein GN956_G11156 [Arapaima gigas]
MRGLMVFSPSTKGVQETDLCTDIQRTLLGLNESSKHHHPQSVSVSKFHQWPALCTPDFSIFIDKEQKSSDRLFKQ